MATFLLNPEVGCSVVCDVDDSRLAEGVKLVEEKSPSVGAAQSRRVIAKSKRRAKGT